MKKIIVSLSIIAAAGAIVIGGTMAYFASSVKNTGNVISTAGAPDILKISADGTADSWSDEITGFSGTDMFPGYEEFNDIYLKNTSDNANAEIVAYTEENCYNDYESGPCATECNYNSGSYNSDECNECHQKCYNLFNRGIKMKIVEVTGNGEEDLTDGYHYLKEYRNNESGNGEWCNSYGMSGYCNSYGNPPMIKNLGFGNSVHLKAYFQLPETDKDQTDLAGGTTKFDIEFHGREVTPD